MKKAIYVKPEIEFMTIPVEPLMTVISAAVNTKETIPTDEFEAKKHNPQPWGVQDYDEDSQLGCQWPTHKSSLWDDDE